MSLNKHQEQVVKSVGNVLVTACPGSGKTTVMSHKASRLLSKSSGNLVAVTFTKDAASELRHRIIKQCGDGYAHRVGAGTFHSLCMTMCKRAGIKFDLIDEQQRQFIIRKIAGDEIGWQEAQELIDELRSKVERPSEKLRSDLLNSYEAELRRFGKHDFQDIIILTVKGLKQGTIEPLNANWFLVDEVQDMDDWQLEWVLSHARNGIHCTLVGDDDQSIYGFRGSLGFEGMMKFAREMRAQTLTLPVNYRCREEILKPAAKLIENNQNRVFKEINAGRGLGGSIEYKEFETRSLELDYVVSERLKNGSSEWGILGRTNALLDEVELELTKYDIKFKRIGGKRFWESAIALLYLNTLKNLIKPNWLSIQTLFFRFGVDINLLQTSTSAEEILSKMRSNAKGRKAVESYLVNHKTWLNELSVRRTESVLKMVALYIKAHYPLNKDGKSAADVLIKASEFISTKLSGSLSQRLRAIEMLYSDSKDEESHKITLMTMHASKGLEFEKAWMLGCEDGEIPAKDSPIDEERRLFYVAMTRAKDYLLMTRAKLKVSESGETKLSESRFLLELN